MESFRNDSSEATEEPPGDPNDPEPAITPDKSSMYRTLDAEIKINSEDKIHEDRSNKCDDELKEYSKVFLIEKRVRGF